MDSWSFSLQIRISIYLFTSLFSLPVIIIVYNFVTVIIDNRGAHIDFGNSIRVVRSPLYYFVLVKCKVLAVNMFHVILLSSFGNIFLYVYLL